MLRTLLITGISLLSVAAIAGKKEPCKALGMPTATNNEAITFELPTYEEYIVDIAIESTNISVTVDEENILNENVFEKIRREKIEFIQNHYTGNYVIMSKLDMKKSTSPNRYVFRESIITDLVDEDNDNFEEYTSFEIQDNITEKVYRLTDVTDDNYTECIVGKEDYRYVDVLELL